MADVTLVHDIDIERRGDGSAPADVGGDFRDTELDQETGSSYGTAIAFNFGVRVSEKAGPSLKYGLIWFDLKSFLPADAVITSAIWWINLALADSDSSHTYEVRRVEHNREGGNPEWVEDEATWDEYSTGNNWSGTPWDALNDTTTPIVSLGAITTIGWKTFTITSMVTDAWSNRNGICTFLVRRSNLLTENGQIQARSKEYRVLSAEKPHHLRITYTLDGKTYQAFIL